MRIPNGLIEAVRQRQAVLFAGAGMSYSSFQLLGNNIRDAIGAEIQKDYANYDYRLRTLEDVCDQYVALNDRIKSRCFAVNSVLPETGETVTLMS